MSILIAGDDIIKLLALRDMLGSRIVSQIKMLGDHAISDNNPGAIIIVADLRNVECVTALRQLLAKLNREHRRIFIVEQRERLSTAQAYALGASQVLMNPVTKQRLFSALFGQKNLSADAKKRISGSAEAAHAGAASLASMFRAVQSGLPIDMTASRIAGRAIADCVSENGLSDWLDTVRRHHEGTYQHCLLVTGLAVDFGLSLGMNQTDIERLHTAAMFHDIGKARIPLSILDKPTQLDREERAVIESHAAIGYELLKDAPNIPPETLDGIRHHHEYLDGSGYPDALSGQRITDIVRVLTICDIFAALIEQRKYKPAMSRQSAYEIIKSMNGKLEKALVVAFGEVAIKR